MGVWTDFVDLIYMTLLGLSAAFGGNMGLAIGALSLGVRLALLPLTLSLARRALEVQCALKKLEPQLSSIRKTHKSAPERLWKETEALHRQHGIKVVEGKTILGSLIQVPLFLGLFAAVQRGLSGTGRFLWIKDLMKADPWLACICAILTALSAYLAPSVAESQRAVSILLPAALTLVFLWNISAGVAVYSLSSSMVGVVQSLLIRRGSRV